MGVKRPRRASLRVARVHRPTGFGKANQQREAKASWDWYKEHTITRAELGRLPPDERAATLEAYGLSPDGIPMQMNPLLVDTGDQRVIIDPGKGFGEENELLRALAGG